MTQSTVICVALVAALSVMVSAQQDCQSISGLKEVNATKFAGVWYEVAQAPAASSGCIKTNILLASNNTQLNLTTLYSSSNSSLYMDKSETAFINITVVNPNTGFNLTYNGVNTTYKILDTDYTTFVTVCGYTSSNASSSFGAIYSSKTDVNSTWLDTIITSTSKVLTNFNSTSVRNVTQKGCYASSASTSVPYLTSMFALLFLVAKFRN